jgi:hypothetical protein
LGKAATQSSRVNRRGGAGEESGDTETLGSAKHFAAYFAGGTLMRIGYLANFVCATTAGRAERRAVAGARALIVPLCILLGGCFRFGPINLNMDQIDYSRAVAEGERAQTLLNIIRIRYGDTPTFVNATQVISGYQLQRNVNGTFEVFPHAAASTFLGGGGSVQLQESPTFTFQPVGGEAFAQSFLRPLPPDQLLPLLLTAAPVDMLLGLTVQSIGSLHNASGFGATAREEGADFDRLLHDLRKLQLAGLIRIRLEETFGPDGKPLPRPKRVYFSLKVPRDPDLAAVVTDARRLLGLQPRAVEVEVVYGQTPSTSAQIAVLTRSMLEVLTQIALQAEVPPGDIARGRTVPTMERRATERRAFVTIHSGPSKPDDSFGVVEYDKTWFWIDNNDFDSKVAFTFITIMLAAAKTITAPGAIITIPAG